jgi:hypothetical protein
VAEQIANTNRKAIVLVKQSAGFEFFKRLLVYLKHSCLKYKTSLWSFPRSSDRIIREYQQCLQREPVLMACCARLLAQGIAELPNEKRWPNWQHLLRADSQLQSDCIDVADVDERAILFRKELGEFIDLDSDARCIDDAMASVGSRAEVVKEETETNSARSTLIFSADFPDTLTTWPTKGFL